MTHDYIIGTMIPQHFLPGLGYVAVQHAQMDHAVNMTIWLLAGTGQTAGTAVTSAIMSLRTRLGIMQNLVLSTISESNEQDKLSAICESARELNSRRNRLFHDVSYYYSPHNDEVGFFRAENLTDPQIKVQAPSKMTRTSLQALGDEMFKIKVWLGMRLPRFPDCPHPDWTDDAQFPWPDKLEQQRKKRRKTPG